MNLEIHESGGWLEERLREVEDKFERQLRERGFDPAQAELIALPGPLAKIYAEREKLRADLDKLKADLPRATRSVVAKRMNEIERIEVQLKLAFEGGAWHGPAVLETLEGITAKQAAAHPLAGVHSIWELVVHIAAWEDACRRRLGGDRAELSTAEDWPPVTDTTETAWVITKAALIEGHDKLRAAIAFLTAARLDEPILQNMPSVYITIHGVIQHDLYHAGQIAILKKNSLRGLTI
ncbi:MAG: DinB family protein [Pyrinomonadaceae bacterium]|nr:DinB family protein [Pyrinomonadaceae bacterium]